MIVKIREYKKEDYDYLIKFMIGLQDYLVKIDSYKLMRRMPKYGKSYTDRLLIKVKKNKGKIFFAEVDHKIVGVIAGIILKTQKEDLLEVVPLKKGFIEELFIYPEYRSLKIGKKLMQKLEDYFKKEKCNIFRVDVFAKNPAYDFYCRLGYKDRMISMFKLLK